MFLSLLVMLDLILAILTEKTKYNQEVPECYSLFGKPLYAPDLPLLVNRSYTILLSIAEREYKDDACGVGMDPMKAVWVGRRIAYFWHYNHSIEIYSEALQKHDHFAKLYRHRGHRYISVRKFEEAIQDFKLAATFVTDVPDEYEPDGAPNKYNIPTSTTNTNIYYHYGLSLYLNGDFPAAYTDAYDHLLPVSRETNNDMFIATTNWAYMTLRRMGKEKEAQILLDPIHVGMDLVEDEAYLNLTLMYKGILTPEEVLPSDASPLDLATLGYGVGNWYYYNGEKDKAKDLWEKVLNTSYWSAFGYIAAEADLYRWKTTYNNTIDREDMMEFNNSHKFINTNQNNIFHLGNDSQKSQ